MAQMQATQLVTSGLWGLLYYREIRGRALWIWVGFALWTFMLVRIRRHRITRLLRAEAFKRNHDAGIDSESSEDAGVDEAQPDADWL